MGIAPVLVDVGASGAPPRIWSSVAPQSIYVGFDPDLREMRTLPDGVFKTSYIVNRAVVAGEGGNVLFHLTRSPFCSSVLPPDARALSDWLFSDLFDVVSVASVPAESLDTVLVRLGLERIDWLKTDSQGTDLRIFRSLCDSVRAKVLAVDVEPGLIDAYQGEDLFVDAHRELLREGFWLSSMNVRGSVRMKRSTLSELAGAGVNLDERAITGGVRTTPGWCEARYFRSIDALGTGDEEQRSLTLLWAFALLDGQYGFALDIAAAYARTCGRDSLWSTLVEAPARFIRRRRRRTALGRLGRKVLDRFGVG